MARYARYYTVSYVSTKRELFTGICLADSEEEAIDMAKEGDWTEYASQEINEKQDYICAQECPDSEHKVEIGEAVIYDKYMDF